IYEKILKDLQSAGNAGEFYTPRALTDFMAERMNLKIGDKVADFACGTGGFLTSALKCLEPQIKTPSDKEIYNQSVYGIEKKALPHILCVTNMLLHDIDSPEIIHGNSLETKVANYRKEEGFDVILMNPPYGGNENKSVQMNFPPDLRASETADLFMSVIMYRLKYQGRAAVVIPDGFLFGTEGAKRNIKEKLLKEFNLHTILRLPKSVFSPYTSIATNVIFIENNEGQGTDKVWFYRMDMPSDRKNFSKTKPIENKHFDDIRQWWDNRIEITDDDGNYQAKAYNAKEIAELNYNLDLCGYPQK
ncbi:HsdM family class I SAM-dependent methyltransferase, partial [Spirabiliibacterium mucosae]|uniref:HsdM family class I SAM-dependent methyltransferase n=1 Tax=Spirabiliibacterium mucosae TaxID=28156 RepID=UPI001F1B3BBD